MSHVWAACLFNSSTDLNKYCVCFLRYKQIYNFLFVAAIMYFYTGKINKSVLLKPTVQWYTCTSPSRWRCSFTTTDWIVICLLCIQTLKPKAHHHTCSLSPNSGGPPCWVRHGALCRSWKHNCRQAFNETSEDTIETLKNLCLGRKTDRKLLKSFNVYSTRQLQLWYQSRYPME